MLREAGLTVCSSELRRLPEDTLGRLAQGKQGPEDFESEGRREESQLEGKRG